MENQIIQLVKPLQDFFNATLKKHFNVPETFIISPFEDENSNGLEIKSNIKSKLFETLKKNKKLFSQLQTQIVAAFLKHFPLSKDIYLYYVDEYTMEIRYDFFTESIQDYLEKEIGPYANIAANLSFNELAAMC